MPLVYLFDQWALDRSDYDDADAPAFGWYVETDANVDPKGPFATEFTAQCVAAVLVAVGEWVA